MPRLLPMNFRMMTAEDIPLLKAESKRNRDVCVMPTGRLLMKCLSRLTPTNSRKMLMKSEEIQERAIGPTEELKNVEELKGFNFFCLFKCTLARELFTFKGGERRYQS